MADEDITTVWADQWNPPTDEWSPSAEPHNTWGVAQPGHGDLAVANPMTDTEGHAGSGSVPDVRDNLLTDVKRRVPVPPPPLDVHHVVENVERGAESISVRQITVVGNQAVTQLLEMNRNRRRALVRIVPNIAGASSRQSFNGSASAVGTTVTVPAGQQWTLQSLAALINESAVAATRTPTISIRDNIGNVVWSWISPQNLTASQQATISLTPGSPSLSGGAAPNFVIDGPLPAITLGPGWSINVAQLAGDAGDNVSSGLVVFAGVSPAVFVAARAQPGSAAASQTWFKLLSGDAPLEVKSQDGLDGIGVNSTDSIAVQVYEELVGARPDMPGIGV